MPETARTRTAIVADGEPLFLIEASCLLQDAGYAVVEARNRAELVALLRSLDAADLLVVGALAADPVTNAAIVRDAMALRPGMAVVSTPVGDWDVRPGRRDGATLLPRPFAPSAFLAAVAGAFG